MFCVRTPFKVLNLKSIRKVKLSFKIPNENTTYDLSEMSVFENEPSVNIAVIGAGAMGTAMAQIAAKRGNKVKLYSQFPNDVKEINRSHKNPSFLPNVALSENITATNSVEDALQDASYCILSIPTQIVPDWLRDHKALIKKDLLLCNTAKGLYLKESNLLSEAICSSLERDNQPYAVLSGPSFAKEMIYGQPTAVVVASKYLYDAVRIQRSLSSFSFRCYTSQDVIGVELGGALKNPLAIGAGMIQGYGFGTNTLSFFLTRSTLELQSLVKAMGGRPETVNGLSGVGDLMLTAFGDLSRNRQAGMRVAKGEKIEDILKEMTVEGVHTAQVAIKFADRCGLTLPNFQAVAAVLSGKLSIEKALEYLMGQPPSKEFHGN